MLKEEDEDSLIGATVVDTKFEPPDKKNDPPPEKWSTE